MTKKVMIRESLGWTVLFLIQIFSFVFAQEKAPEFSLGNPLSFGQEMTIQSEVFNQNRTVLISLPAEYANKENRYPVVYLTDGSVKRLCLLRSVVDLLADDNKMPNAILVGIVHGNRNNELTPAKSDGESPLLRFMRQELFSVIESTFRTMPSRIYVGHSRGGLFGVYCLLHDPEMFAAQIDVDPSLWWNDGELVNSLATFLKKNPDFENSLFVSETREMQSENGEHFDRLNEVMRRKSNPLFTYGFLELPPAESHNSAILPALYEGLQEIFKDFYRLDYEKITFDDFQKHYSRPILSAVYNLTEGKINDFAYRKLRLKQYAEAINAFKENTLRFPDSANAFYCLGDAYFRADRLRESLASLDKAVELAKKNRDEKLARYISDRDKVKEMLEKKLRADPVENGSEVKNEQ